MPKKRKRGTRSTNLKEVDDDFNEEVNQNDEGFFMDEIDKFHANKDKINLEEDENLQSDQDDDMDNDEEEVLGFENSDSDEDSSEAEDEDDTPRGKKSESAWGKKRSTFYGGDALDGLEGSDREEAERQEEEEVLAIQQRLAKQIDEDDIGLEFLQVAQQSGGQGTQELLKSHVTADFSKLTAKAQWKIIRRESPELEDLVKDFKNKLTELKTEICPLMKLAKCGKIPEGYGSDHVKLKYRVYLAYLLNISFYLALKTKKISVQNHPVISRLVQYRTVINQLVPIDKRLRPQIEELLEKMENGEILSEEEENAEMESDDESIEMDEEIVRKRETELNSAGDETNEKIALNYYKSLNEEVQERIMQSQEKVQSNKEDEVDENLEDRRAINYEIAKNKGLSQRKRKIDRNPRVKMRHKYKKAKIRRKGQVREYRPEIKKYSGEASGIRAGLKKSVTLQ